MTMAYPRPTGHTAADPLDYSLIIPVYNEEGNLHPLHERVTAAMEALGGSYEVILVDDGSRDASAEELAAIAAADQRVKVVQFRRNFGQTAAMSAGIDHSRGEVLVFLDADLQNDPADIPRLIEKINQGYDVVSGWREKRKDAFVSRTLPSHLANSLISWATGVHLHDYGCSLKAYRAEVLRDIRLYGEMHRFVPIYASWAGGRVAEIVVNHRARQFGVSKYGINRTFKVLLDLLTVKFLSNYATKPIYLFGGIGLVLAGLGALVALGVVIGRFIWTAPPFQHNMSLLLLSTFLFTIGLMLVMMGLLAEIIIRTYHEAQGKQIYLVRSVLNPAPPAGPRD